MKLFKDGINTSIENLNKNITNPEINKDDWLDSYLNEFKNAYSNVTRELSIYQQVYTSIEKSTETLDSQLKFQTKASKDKYHINLSNISTSSKLDVNKLKQEINSRTVKTEKFYIANKEEKLLIASTTNPYIYSNLIDRNANIELLNANKKEIMDKYNFIVDDMTKKRNIRNNDVISNNNKYMHTYDEASTNIKASIESKLKKIQVDLSQIDSLLNQLKQIYDNESLEVEKRFNEDVRKNNRYAANKKLELKAEYDKDRQTALEFKNDSEAKNLVQRSSAMKEFATEISRLNDKLDMLKYNQVIHTKENTSIFELNIFDIKAKIRKIQEEIINNPSTAKQNKQLIKELNSQKKLENKALKQKIKTINRSYNEKYAAINREKDIHESINNGIINKLSNIEIIDNNTYHNKLHILQKTYEHNINLINDELDLKIKALRSKYDEEKLELMKEYKIKQTNLFKKRQAFVHEINLVEDELKMTQLLEDQVHENNKKQVNNIISKSNIDSLLEIEKNDMMTEFFLDRIKMLEDLEYKKYTYNESKNFNMRDRKTAIVDSNSKKETIDLEHSKIIYSLEIQKVIAKEEFERNIEDILYIEHNANIKATYTFSHFSNKKKELLALYNFTSSAINSLINTTEIYLIKAQLAKSEAYSYQVLRTITSQINLAIKSFITLFNDRVIKIINNQIELETGEKYNQLLEALERSFTQDIFEINEREDNLTKTINNYNNGIRHFYSNISKIETTIRGLTQKMNALKITRSAYNREVAELKNEKKRLLALINKNENQIDNLKQFVQKIPRLKETITQEHEKKRAIIVKRQQDEAAILYKALDDNKALNASIVNTIDSISNIAAQPLENKKYYNVITELKREYYKPSKVLTKFINIIESLDNSYTTRYHKLLSQNNYSYRNQKNTITRRYEKKTLQIDTNIFEENEKYSNKIRECLAETTELINKYKANEDEINDKFHKETKEINQEISRLRKDYYIKTCAIKMSLLENIKNSNKNAKSLNVENNNINKQLVAKYMANKRDIKLNTIKLLNEYSETINLIPSEFKAMVKNLRDEYSEQEKLYNDNYKLKSFEFNKEIKEKNKEALKYSSEIHNKIIKINSNISKQRKALTLRYKG